MNVLVVGSSVIDLFLQLRDNSHIEIHPPHIAFTLGDKIPTNIKKLTLGGNGANVSVGLTRLGISSTFYTYLGNDVLSKYVEETIEKEGIKLIAERGSESSSLSLIFTFPQDRIIFSHHPKTKHNFNLPDDISFDYIFLSAIGEGWEETYEKVVTLAKSHNAKLLFSPGVYELEGGGKSFMDTLNASFALFVNKEEAKIIAEKAQKFASDNAKELLTTLHTCGIEVVSITDGTNGSYCLNNNTFYTISSFGDKTVEKTGAGDAYVSGFLGAFLQDKPIEIAMKWGAINAFSVMSHVGAQEGLLKTEELDTIFTKHTAFAAERL